MNKFILDFDLLKENDLSLDLFTTLISIYKDLFVNPNYVDELQKLGFIKIIQKEEDEVYILREKAKLFIESIKSKEVENYKEERLYKPEKTISSFDEFVKEYRSLWDGLKPGAMGSKTDCATKMRKWMINNPEYTQEDILRAARSYINSVDNIKYLQQADYFIYKKDKYTETSRLSALIDEGEILEGGWSSALK